MARLKQLTTLDWLIVALGFLCAFFLSIAGALESARLMQVLALMCGLGALGLLGYLMWSRRDAAAHAEDWHAFAEALPTGVLIDVPDEMSYARELDQLADELAELGEAPYDGAPARARNAVFGESGAIHYCAFQYVHSGRTDTVGLIALRPDRAVDSFPDVWVTPAEREGSTFAERFEVSSSDESFVRELLTDDAQRELLDAQPFSWALLGNQILTYRPGASGPKATFEFIETRLQLLAQIADDLPPTAGTGTSNAPTDGANHTKVTGE